MRFSSSWSVCALTAAAVAVAVAQGTEPDNTPVESSIETVFTSYILSPILVTSYPHLTSVQTNPAAPSSASSFPVTSPTTDVDEGTSTGISTSTPSTTVHTDTGTPVTSASVTSSSINTSVSTPVPSTPVISTSTTSTSVSTSPSVSTSVSTGVSASTTVISTSTPVTSIPAASTSTSTSPSVSSSSVTSVSTTTTTTGTSTPFASTSTSVSTTPTTGPDTSSASGTSTHGSPTSDTGTTPIPAASPSSSSTAVNSPETPPVMTLPTEDSTSSASSTSSRPIDSTGIPSSSTSEPASSTTQASQSSSTHSVTQSVTSTSTLTSTLVVTAGSTTTDHPGGTVILPPGEEPSVTTTHQPGTTIHPPEDNPPGDNPPGDNPPGDNPPGDNPPGDNPPGDNPPGDNPPGDNPPGDNPPGDNPPGDNPPGDNPPGDNPPPAVNPPTTSPPQPSTTSSSTSASCTSDITAYQVTIRCEPTSITSGSSTISSSTCSPSTTHTTTGCSVTGTTTTVTSTPTPTADPLCDLDTCGKACPHGQGGWATISSVDCAHVPTVTVSAFPSESPGYRPVTESGLARRENSLAKRVLPDPTPLPDVEDEQEHLKALHRKITQENKWASQQQRVTGKWYPFGREVTAMGINALWGCTAVLITTSRGVYMSHIYEGGIFATRDEQGNRILSDLDYFQHMTTDALTRGGPEFLEVESIERLKGTDQDPGPLHHSFKPKVFVFTPFVEHTQVGELQYQIRADWIAGELARFIYPQFDQNEPLPWLVSGYEATNFYSAYDDETVVGKIVLEVSPLNHYEVVGIQILEVGRWRLWSGGVHIMNWEFWELPYPDNQMKRDTSDKPICPISMSSTSTSTTQTPSTFVTSTTTTSKPTATTTTKTKTTSESSTKTTVKPTNPPGQPPGFTLPTYSKPTSTETETETAPAPPPTGLTLPRDDSKVSDQKCISTPNIRPAEKNDVLIENLVEMCVRGGIASDRMSFARGDPKIEFRVANGYGYPFYIGIIEWAMECDGPAQNPIYPMEGFNCETLLRENFEFKNCDGYGYGGYKVVGCLTYFSQLWGGGQEV